MACRPDEATAPRNVGRDPARGLLQGMSSLFGTKRSPSAVQRFRPLSEALRHTVCLAGPRLSAPGSTNSLQPLRIL